jgi:hypothetical protein
LSIISIAARSMPAAMIPLTAAPASLVETNAASSVWMHSGRFTMRSITLVAMPDDRPESNAGVG